MIHLLEQWSQSGKSRLAFVIFLGGLAGLSTIPILGFQLFFFLAVSLFLYFSKTQGFMENPHRLMAGFGFGYFLAALHWVPFSLHIAWGYYFYLIPFALLGLPLFFALYCAVGSWFVPWHQYEGGMRLFLFGVLWVALELFRAEFLTGFPWASIGYMWTTVLPIAQLISLMGPYLLGGVTLFWVCGFFMLLERRFVFGGLVLCSFLIAFLWGQHRMNHAVFEKAPDVRLRMVQFNSPQEFQWERAPMEKELERFVSLSLSKEKPAPHATIWPEFGLPLAVQIYPWMYPYVKRSVPKDGVLITNGFRYARDVVEPKGYRVHTSILSFNGVGELASFYDKYRLLPFGEYIPLRREVDRIFPGQIHKISGGMGDFCQGLGPKTCSSWKIPPFIPMLCHEVIFSGSFHAPCTRHAKWLLNLTNDGWFLNSLEPYQHLEMARMRAIEFGLPMVRVANTGVSAVIDALGRTLIEIPYGKVDVVDFALPPVLEGRTPYGRLMEHDVYDWIYRLIWILMGGRLFWWMMRRRKA